MNQQQILQKNQIKSQKLDVFYNVSIKSNIPEDNKPEDRKEFLVLEQFGFDMQCPGVANMISQLGPSPTSIEKCVPFGGIAFNKAFFEVHLYYFPMLSL